MAAEILAAAGRAMSDAELFEALVTFGLRGDTLLRDMAQHLSADRSTFVYRRPNWQLRKELGDNVLEVRRDPPDLPPPMTAQELTDGLEYLAQSSVRRDLAVLARDDRRRNRVPIEQVRWEPGRRSESLAQTMGESGMSERMRTHPALDGLRPEDAAFPILAGTRLVSALSSLPTGERRSIGQVLSQQDEAKLVAWLSIASPSTSIASDPPQSAVTHDLSPRVLEGLTMLAAFTAAVRRSGRPGIGYWTAIRDACGEASRAWLFNNQEKLRRPILSRIGEVAILLDLRRAFGVGDPWLGLLALQAGFRANDLAPNWLGWRRPPVRIRLLLAPGPNHSASMAFAWNVLQAYRRGNATRTSLEILATACDWWPGWTVTEVCDAYERGPAAQPSDRSSVVSRKALITADG